MAKRLTIKQQRELDHKAQLLQRVRDVYAGSTGSVWTDDDFATAEQLALVIPALQSIFGEQLDGRDYLWATHCIKYFDTPESATDHLFGAGIRA